MLTLLSRLLRCLFCGHTELIFSSVEFEDIKIRGNITMVEMEYSQAVTFTASPIDRRGNPAVIEAGSAQWSIAATDADGNDVSAELILEVDPENELSATVTSQSVDLTGIITLRADGDPSADEVIELVATADIIVHAGNAVALSLSNTAPVDV